MTIPNIICTQKADKKEVTVVWCCKRTCFLSEIEYRKGIHPIAYTAIAIILWYGNKNFVAKIAIVATKNKVAKPRAIPKFICCCV
jgi:hypothetical protein